MGDTFGHSDESIGRSNLTQDLLTALQKITGYPLYAVWGNWEYWLFHPEEDEKNKSQRLHRDQLMQRRIILSKNNNSRTVRPFHQQPALLYPSGGKAEFTLFHGAPCVIHANSAYYAQPWETYLYPRDVNVVSRTIFANPDHLSTPHFLFGHTHIPGWFIHSETTLTTVWQYFTPDRIGKPIDYGSASLRYGINPGTAGIEGKGTPRTALLLDTEEKNFTYLADDER